MFAFKSRNKIKVVFIHKPKNNPTSPRDTNLVKLEYRMGDSMDKTMNNKPVDANSKEEQLDQYRIQNIGKPITTNQGKKIANDQFNLKAGDRGPTLQEDWHYFEKMTHFVHEEQPERVVHARGYSAHGYFECYQ